MANTYRDAGVDIEAGYEAVKRMGKHVARTNRAGAIGALGGFGGMFDLSALHYRKPVLVSGTDGVGTKLKLAFLTNKHDTIGIDCVAMCVNDIIVQGAEPLFFLDYIGCGNQNPETIEQIVKGVAEGCVQAGCALVGGETAEMPDMYEEGEYDLAGFAVGACEKEALVTGKNTAPGDVLIGLASSGIHSNGYSLIRKIFLKDHAMTVDTILPELGRPLGEVLLTPTKIYVKPVLSALKKFEIKGMAHVTGGGFYENMPRMLRAGLGVEISLGSWPVPPVFSAVESYGNVSRDEMFHVFNMGIGFVLAVNSEDAQAAVSFFNQSGEQAFIIGHVTNTAGVRFAAGSRGDA